MVLMKNVYDKKLKISLDKMCNKDNKDGEGDLCIGITLPNKTTRHNYHIKKRDFIEFVNKHYLKEILKEYGLTKLEFDLFVGARKV